MRPLARLIAAAAALGLWLALYFLGRTAGGAIHLLPVAALALHGEIGGQDNDPVDPPGHEVTFEVSPVASGSGREQR